MIERDDRQRILEAGSELRAMWMKLRLSERSIIQPIVAYRSSAEAGYRVKGRRESRRFADFDGGYSSTTHSLAPSNTMQSER